MRPRPSPRSFSTRARVSSLRVTRGVSAAPSLAPCHHSRLMTFARNAGHSLARATRQDLGIKTPRGACPRNRKPRLAPPPPLEPGLGGLGAAAMTGRGTPSRFLTSVLHNGLGRYVQQLQRLSFRLSRDAPSSRGAR